MSHKLNLHRNDHDPRGHMLCPFREYLFEVDGVLFSSVENFMLSFRVPPMTPHRVTVTLGTAMQARKVALGIEEPECVQWKGREISMRSKTFDRLFERMMRMRYRKDADAVSALWASKRTKFVHEAPKKIHPTSVVPIRLYCDLLERFRDELHETRRIAKPVHA